MAQRINASGDESLGSTASPSVASIQQHFNPAPGFVCLPIPSLTLTGYEQWRPSGITAVSEGSRPAAGMGKSAPSRPHLLSHCWIPIPLPRRRMRRAVHLFICHQSGLAPARQFCFLRSHCLVPLVYQRSPLDQSKLLDFIQSCFICPLCIVSDFCSHSGRPSWPSVTGSPRSRDPTLSVAGSLPPAPVIEDGCQNKAGGMNWHDEVRK